MRKARRCCSSPPFQGGVPPQGAGWSTASSEAMLSDAFLRKLELLTLLPRGRAHGQLRGMHRSRRVGTGMVFADYRPYTEGDDIRHVDWGIYLRLDRLILRLFEEEADLPIYLFLDASQSMDFGRPPKFEYGRTWRWHWATSACSITTASTSAR